jgi:protein-arginine kinase activator protein McsA
LFRVAKEFSVVTVRISKTNEQRMKELSEAGKCLGCEHKFVKDETVRRGLCIKCYRGTMHAIRVGKTSEEDRLREGRLKEASGGGRRPSNDYIKELLGK